MVSLCNCIEAHICHPVRATVPHATECKCHDCNRDKIINPFLNNDYSDSDDETTDRCVNCQDCESVIYDGTERCEGVHIKNGLRLCHDETPHSGRCECCRSDNYYYYDLSLCMECDIKYMQAYEKIVSE
jgi:hypothetical protein